MRDTQIFPKEFGFVTEGNSSAAYCLISSLKNKYSKPNIENLKDYVGFILYINDKHLLSGLPDESIIGTTIRRLLISLSRSPNVRKIYCINFEEHLNTLYNILKQVNTIDDSVLEKICQTGRMTNHDVKISDIKKIFKKIDFIDQCTISDDSGQSLRKLKSYLSDALIAVDRVKLPDESQFLRWHPKSKMDMMFETNDYYPLFDNIESVYKYAQWKLIKFGKIGKDRNDLMRIQLNREFMFEFTNCNMQEIELFLEKNYTIYNNPSVIYEKSVCKEGSFCQRIRGFSDERDKYVEFISELNHALNHDQLCYSKVLYFVAPSDSGYALNQIGWESITPYLNKDEKGYTLSLKHNLRSVDLYDGFPFNFYFCAKISEDILNVLRKEKSNIRLENIYLNIANLHAYIDCISESIYKKGSLKIR